MKALFSAGIIPVHREGDAVCVLLLRAYLNWDFPKGRVDAGEEPFRAALRELEEETTITRVSFPWGEAYQETRLPKQNKTVRYYVAECADRAVALPVSAELGRPEHHEYRWVSFAEARTLVNPRLIPVLEWAEGMIG
jgi:bis(5'-nucleosidyl)-tetraphosphatase